VLAYDAEVADAHALRIATPGGRRGAAAVAQAKGDWIRRPSMSSPVCRSSLNRTWAPHRLGRDDDQRIPKRHPPLLFEMGGGEDVAGLDHRDRPRGVLLHDLAGVQPGDGGADLARDVDVELLQDLRAKHAEI